MNKPYIKIHDKEGNLLNPIKGKYSPKYLNRSQQRAELRRLTHERRSRRTNQLTGVENKQNARAARVSAWILSLKIKRKLKNKKR